MAGVFAAGGIIVGKYVIFVHALNKALSVLSAGRARSVGYLNTHAMSVFVHNFGSIVRPVYALWVGLAFFAAVRTAGGRAIYTRRRRQTTTDRGRNKQECTDSGAHAAQCKSATTAPVAVGCVEDSSRSGSAVHDPLPSAAESDGLFRYSRSQRRSRPAPFGGGSPHKAGTSASAALVLAALGDDRLRRGVDQVVEQGAVA